MYNIVEEIGGEMFNQVVKWGKQNHPCLDQTLLNRAGSCTPERMCEHYEIPSEERAKQLCEIEFKRGTGTYAHILIEEVSEAVSQFDIHKRREELIQVAAVAISWIQKIDRDIERL